MNRCGKTETHNGISNNNLRRRTPRISTRIAVALILCASIASAHAQEAVDLSYAPGELIVKFKRDVSDKDLKDSLDRAELKVLKHFSRRRGKLEGLTHVSTKLETTDALDALRNHPAIEYVEPNYAVYPSGIPNDPQFTTLWPLNNTGQSGGAVDADIDAPEAWNLTTGSHSVIIAVIDTGVDLNHPDLAANIWRNSGEIAGDGLDNDGNGYIDDINGWDFWNNDNTVFDAVNQNPHGTHVAGIIGAHGNNGIGIAGVNWNTTILPLKFIGPTVGFNSGIISSIEYAADKGAKVLNASFTSGFFGKGVMDAIEEAGLLLVASAGNNSANADVTPYYPANFDLGNIVSVAATDHNDLRASISNYGLRNVDLGAPGSAIQSTLPAGQYGNMTGTSMSAAYVSGVAGLIYSLYPELTAAEVKYQILTTVDPISALNGITLTGGRVNAVKAVSPVSPISLIAADGFESGGYSGGSGSWTGGWVASGDIAIRTQDSPEEGARHVRLRRYTGMLLRTANVGGVQGVRLGFWTKINSFEASDQALVKVSADGGPAATLVSYTSANSDNVYRYYEFDLAALFPGATQLQLTFDAEMSATDDNWCLDDIRLTGEIGNILPIADAGPDRVASDYDGDGAEVVTLNGSNSFDPDGDLASYEWAHNGSLLGTTPQLSVNASLGTWTMTLTVTDASGANRSDNIQVTVNGPSMQVFYDDFERTSLNPWTQDAQADWMVSTAQSYPTGTRAAEVDGAATDAQLISPVINLQGRVSALITFSWFIKAELDAGEYLACDVSQDGGNTWTELRRLDGNISPENVWRDET